MNGTGRPPYDLDHTHADTAGMVLGAVASIASVGPEILEITQPNGPDTDLHVGHWDEPVDEYLAEHGPCEWQGPLEPDAA